MSRNSSPRPTPRFEAHRNRQHDATALGRQGHLASDVERPAVACVSPRLSLIQRWGSATTTLIRGPPGRAEVIRVVTTPLA